MQSDKEKFARLIKELPRLAEAQQLVETELLGRPGVLGIHAGLSRKRGALTDTPVLRVLLTDKPSVAFVPSKVLDYRVEARLGTVRDLVVDNPDYQPHPRLSGGIFICRLLPDGSARTGGTLGVILNQLSVGGGAPARRVMLTNYHVVESELLIVDTNPDVSQSSPLLHGSRVVGEILEGTRQARVGDAAILSLDEGVEFDFQSVAEIGPLVRGSEQHGGEPALPGMEVRKRGATTRLTNGRISSTNLSTRLVPSDPSCGAFTQQLLIDPMDDDGVFCDSGDSGSVIVDDSGHLVGLLYRMFEDDDTGEKLGIASPIEPILRHFRLEVAGPEARPSSEPRPVEPRPAEPQAPAPGVLPSPMVPSPRPRVRIR
jgi:hypothetical protein